MTTEIWVNLGSGNGLLSNGTKPLSQAMLFFFLSKLLTAFYLRAVSQEALMNHAVSCAICLEIKITTTKVNQINNTR